MTILQKTFVQLASESLCQEAGPSLFIVVTELERRLNVCLSLSVRALMRKEYDLRIWSPAVPDEVFVQPQRSISFALTEYSILPHTTGHRLKTAMVPGKDGICLMTSLRKIGSHLLLVAFCPTTIISNFAQPERFAIPLLARPVVHAKWFIRFK